MKECTTLALDVSNRVQRVDHGVPDPQRSQYKECILMLLLVRLCYLVPDPYLSYCTVGRGACQNLRTQAVAGSLVAILPYNYIPKSRGHLPQPASGNMLSVSRRMLFHLTSSPIEVKPNARRLFHRREGIDSYKAASALRYPLMLSSTDSTLQFSDRTSSREMQNLGQWCFQYLRQARFPPLAFLRSSRRETLQH